MSVSFGPFVAETSYLRKKRALHTAIERWLSRTARRKATGYGQGVTAASDNLVWSRPPPGRRIDRSLSPPSLYDDGERLTHPNFNSRPGPCRHAAAIPPAALFLCVLPGDCDQLLLHCCCVPRAFSLDQVRSCRCGRNVRQDVACTIGSRPLAKTCYSSCCREQIISPATVIRPPLTDRSGACTGCDTR